MPAAGAGIASKKRLIYKGGVLVLYHIVKHRHIAQIARVVTDWRENQLDRWRWLNGRAQDWSWNDGGGHSGSAFRKSERARVGNKFQPSPGMVTLRNSLLQLNGVRVCMRRFGFSRGHRPQKHVPNPNPNLEAPSQELEKGEYKRGGLLDIWKTRAGNARNDPEMYWHEVQLPTPAAYHANSALLPTGACGECLDAKS